MSDQWDKMAWNAIILDYPLELLWHLIIQYVVLECNPLQPLGTAEVPFMIKLSPLSVEISLINKYCIAINLH